MLETLLVPGCFIEKGAPGASRKGQREEGKGGYVPGVASVWVDCSGVGVACQEEKMEPDSRGPQ